MLSLYLAIFCLFLSLVVLARRRAFHNRQLPPGPVGVPVLGYLPFLDVFNLGRAFSRLADRFGDVFSLRVGTELAVVLNSYEAVKAAFAIPELCSRPDTFMFRFFSRGEHGIASASGERWQVQRKFAHKNLKALGFGNRDRMQSFISEEVKELISVLEEKSGSGAPVEIGYDINASVANIMWAIIAGERRPHGDRKLRDFLQAVNKGIELASTSGILLFMPFLAKILPERLLGIDKLRKWMDESYAFLGEVIEEHKQLPFDGPPRDLVEAFLKEMKVEGAHSSFTDFQLLVLCSELFGAGGEPTSVTVKWALRFLAANPHIQLRAQQEIDAEVGKDRPVTLQDRQSLPYVQALVHELIRYSDIHPIGVPHSPSKDVKLDGGYNIPKGTFVFPNFHRIHRDPAYWERPEELYPEHWLDGEGNFVGGKREGFLAFGVGLRKCPGQEVAVMELFSFVANLLQRFSFRLPEGDDGKIESNPGVVVSPKPYSLWLDPR